MKKSTIRDYLAIGLFVVILQLFSASTYAQTNTDELSPKTQQYIDTLNEVKEAQNDGKPIDRSSETASQGTSIWTYVFYGALSGAAYAFWRWIKRLKSR